MGEYSVTVTLVISGFSKRKRFVFTDPELSSLKKSIKLNNFPEIHSVYQLKGFQINLNWEIYFHADLGKPHL